MTDIPEELVAHALMLGRVEWSATAATDAEGHALMTAETVRLTAERFEQDGPQPMHFLSLEGSGRVLCDAGTSPNSANTARIITALWNRFVTDCEALSQASGEAA